MDAGIKASAAAEKKLLKRVNEVYSEALKTAIKQNRSFLRTVEDVMSGKKKPHPYYNTPEKAAKWRQGFINELMRKEGVIENITKVLQDAGAALAPDIKQELAEIYRLNAAYTANTVTGAANKANIRATFNIPTTKQAMIALEDERPVMSKIAFNSLQDANALVHRLQNEMAQFIALGENQNEFIKRIQNVMQDGQKRAKRIAQTEGTRVQSQARHNTIHEAAQMGINVQKRWSTRMVNSRESHVVLNGKVVGADEKFKTITGYELAYPGDPSAPAAEVINCYCVLVPVVEKATGNDLKSAGQNGTIAAPKKTLAGAEQGAPMSFEEADNFHVNPKYGTAGGYSINCQSCVPTFEARLRGFDVEVMPNTRGSACERLSRQTNLVWVDPATGKHPDYILDKTAQTPKKYLKFIAQTVKQGERYSIEFAWGGRGNSGHIVNLDRDASGNLRIKDNQRGQKEKSEWVGDGEVLSYLSRLKYTRTIYGAKYPCVPQLLRLDTMDFDETFAAQIMKAVK